MSEVFASSGAACSQSSFSNPFEMLRNPLPSFAEGQTVFSASHRGIRPSHDHDRSVSPHTRLECPGIEVPLNSPPPLHSAFLVWNPKTRGLELAQPQPPVSPHFVGRSRFPSEVSTISTTSTESSGFWGDASDREDEVEDVISPPVPPPTPFAFKGDATDNEPVEMHPSLPASTTIEYLDRPTVLSRFSSAEYSSLWRRPKDNLYKTKPCKFYYNDRSCIKGDKCNFIHDEWDHAYRVPRPRVERRAGPPPAPMTTSGRCRADGGAREPHPTTPRPTELCILPQKLADNAQKPRSPNFYPITWRVIGGGVMMGGKREVCQDFMAGHCHEGTDCKLAHPGDDEADSSLNTLSSYMSPLSPVLEEPVYTTFNDLSTLLLHQASAQSSVLGTPVLSAPAIAAQASPHQTEERRRRGRRAKKPLTIFPPPLTEQPELAGYSAHRVLDGSTLIEYEASPPPAAETSDLSPDHLDTVSAARSFVRPLSTPPSLNLQRPQVAKLFAAEMP